MRSWEALENGVYRYRDSCCVYAVRGAAGQWLFINAGTGRAAACLAELGDIRGATVLLTHHFRDHTAGAQAFRGVGARIFAPYWERDHLREPQHAFRSRETRLLYDLIWDNFAPIEPISVDRWMMDYEQTVLAGLPIEVIPAPGVSMGAVAYGVELSNGRKVAFIGELMSSPGRLARLSPLQYGYNDLQGGENVLLSWDRVAATNPDAVFPSLGEPFGDITAAVAQLRRNLEGFDSIQPGFAARLAKPSTDSIEQVHPRLFRAKKTVAETHFILGRSGRVLALDYGYDMAGIHLPQRAEFSTRRTLLHSVDALKQRIGTDRIDTVLATHYHDDHIGGIPLLQRLFQTELWAGDNFADLIENPSEFDRPCLWPDPIPVARRLPLGKRFFWEDVAITLHPMVGHTEFSSLILLEFDGCRVAHTGDELFFQNASGANTVPGDASAVFTNHVYKNGLALGGYLECLGHLRSFRPEIILSGHAAPYRPDEHAWALIEKSALAFDCVHRTLMPLGDDAVHFGPESQPGKLQPYILFLPEGKETAALHGWVLNPFNEEVTAEIRIATPPEGWHAQPVILSLAPREKRPFTTTLTVARGGRHRRQPIALDLTVNGRPFGQVAEAWVTVGFGQF